MKNIIMFVVSYLWASIIAFTFPACFGWIYLDMTGHSKGYGYDLGSESQVSMMIGCVELMVWCMLALPSNVYVFQKLAKKSKPFLIFTIALFVALAAACLMILGGWSAYSKEVFNI